MSPLVQNVNFTANLKSKPGSPKNSIAEVGLLIIISGLLLWFVVLPKKAQVTASQASLSTLQGQESQMASTLSKLQQLVQTLNTSQQQVAELDQALPLDGNVPRFQLLVQSLAQSVGVTVNSLNVSDSASNEVVAGNKALLSDPYGAQRSLQTLAGVTTVSGSFDQLEAFLTKIEDSGRLIDIQALSINGGTANTLTLQLNFNAYYLGPAAPAS